MKKILFVDPKNSFEPCKLWFQTSIPLIQIESISYFPSNVNNFDLVVASSVPPNDIFKYPPLILIDENILNTNILLYNSADLIRYTAKELEIKHILSMIDPPIMSGELSNHSVAEILNTIKMIPNRKRLRIFKHSGRGCIFLDNDDLIYAEYQGKDSHSGINAISFLLTLKSGYFDVRETFCAPEFSNISGAVDIILNTLKYRDDKQGPTSFSDSTDQSQTLSIKNIQDKIDCISSVAIFSEEGRLKEITDPQDKKILSDLNNIVFPKLLRTTSLLNMGRINALAISTEGEFLAVSNKLFDRMCLKGESRCDLMSNCTKLLEL
jgi:hypothetical protein